MKLMEMWPLTKLFAKSLQNHIQHTRGSLLQLASLGGGVCRAVSFSGDGASAWRDSGIGWGRESFGNGLLLGNGNGMMAGIIQERCFMWNVVVPQTLNLSCF